MKLKALKILFFTNGPAPTPEQIVEANAMNANVCFRNATVVPNEPHCLEDCHGVAGDVPPVYAAKFPPAAAAIEAREQSIAELSAKVGDSPAPKPPAKAAGKPKDDGKAPTPPTTAPTPASAPAAAPAPGWNPQGNSK